MCKCRPEIRTPFCGRPGCEVPLQNLKDTPDLACPSCNQVLPPKNHAYSLMKQIANNLLGINLSDLFPEDREYIIHSIKVNHHPGQTKSSFGIISTSSKKFKFEFHEVENE